MTIDAGGRLWNVNNFEHESLGPIDLDQAIAYSDNTVFAQLTNIVGPENVVSSGAGDGDHHAAPALLLDRARRRAGDAARDGARLRDARRRRRTGSTARSSATSRSRSRASSSRARADPAVDEPRRSSSQVLTSTNAAIVDQLLQGVVGYGTGTAAQIPGSTVAGKTGTTENYGDAWFVGFTPHDRDRRLGRLPEQARADADRSSTAQPVEGGTYPALIWKAFMEKALAYLATTRLQQRASTPFPTASVPYSTPATVVYDYSRSRLELDNGNCRGALPIDFFGGMAPTAVATCKPNEVDVPDVRGETLDDGEGAPARPAAPPGVVYEPAKPGERLGVVVGQIPQRGHAVGVPQVRLCSRGPCTASSHELIGLSVANARARLARVKLSPTIFGSTRGTVVAQNVPAGRRRRRRACGRAHGAAGRESAAEEARAGEAVAPRALGGFREPDPRAGHELGTASRRGRSSNGGSSSGSPSCSRVTPSAWQRRPGPEQRSRGSSTPRRRRISSSPRVGLERAHEHRARGPFRLADEVQAPVHAVGAVDVGVAGRAEHRGVPGGAAAVAVRRADRRARRPRPRRSARRHRRRGARRRSACAQRRGRRGRTGSASRGRVRGGPARKAGVPVDRGAWPVRRRPPQKRLSGRGGARRRLEQPPRPPSEVDDVEAPLLGGVGDALGEIEGAVEDRGDLGRGVRSHRRDDRALGAGCDDRIGDAVDPDPGSGAVAALAVGERLECVDPVGADVLAEPEEDHPGCGVCHGLIMAARQGGSHRSLAGRPTLAASRSTSAPQPRIPRRNRGVRHRGATGERAAVQRFSGRGAYPVTVL